MVSTTRAATASRLSLIMDPCTGPSPNDIETGRGEDESFSMAGLVCHHGTTLSVLLLMGLSEAPDPDRRVALKKGQT